MSEALAGRLQQRRGPTPGQIGLGIPLETGLDVASHGSTLNIKRVLLDY